MSIYVKGHGRSLLSSIRTITAFFVSFALVFGLLALPRSWVSLLTTANAASSSIVISQVYGAGGNSGATYTNDFVELFNRGNAPASLAGWSIQYSSSTGTGLFSSNITELPAVTLQPGQYFLVQESGGATGVSLPSPDFVDATPISMAAGAGKVIVANVATGLACNGSSTPCNATQLSQIVDLVGYGTGTNFFEGSGPTATISATLSAQRAGSGCTDTDNNSSDFTAIAVAPRNSASPTHPCTVTSTNPTGSGSANPSSVFPGDNVLLTVTVTPGANPTSTGIAVSADISSIGGSATQQFFDDGTNGDAAAGDNVFSFATTVDAATTAGPKSLPVMISDGQSRSSTTSISLTVQTIIFGQTIPFVQNWSDTNQITADNTWSGVPGIVGYRGDNMAGATGVDPQTILLDGSSTPVNVIANQVNPNTLTSGGIAEFQIADPVVAFQGSGTARAPHLVISVNTTGQNNITVFYNLRDIDGSNDNSVQPVALQYRIGNSGNYTNVPTAFVADASSGPADASLVTPVAVVLPAAVNNKPLVQLRIITSDALGSDEWIGIDDIQVVANGTIPLSASGSATPNRVNANTDTLLKVRVNPANNPDSSGISVNADLTAIGGSSTQQFYDDGTHGDITAADDVFSYLATVSFDTFSGNKSLPVSVSDAQSRTASTTISLGVNDARDPQTHLVMGNPSNATVDINNPLNYLLLKNEYVVGYNRDRGTPNWVSWHLDSSWLGTAPRQDDFRPDPSLPDGWYQVTQFDYSGSGFDRGHHTPSGDRTATIAENSATFFMTNMMPQSPDNNQGPWEELESFSRTLVNQGNELYIIGGGTGTGGTGSNGGITQTITDGKVTVPAFTWKVMIVMSNGGDDVNRVGNDTRTIAIIMPNIQGIRNDPWQKYIATVDQVEALTGYDFFSNVPTSIQDVIESRLDSASNTAPTANAQSVITNEDTPLEITLTASDPNVNNVLTYTVTSGPTNGTLSGTGSSLTYTPNANFYGSDSFDFEVSDGALTSSATVTINVGSVNDPPVLDPILDKTVFIGDTLNFTATASDVDLPNDSLTFSLTGTVPAGASINPSTGAFAWTPAVGQVGAIYPVGVRVTDSSGLYFDRTVNVGVAYTWTGIIGPAGGGGTFRTGSIVPIKFKLTGVVSGITNAQARLFYARVIGGSAGTEIPAVGQGSQNIGNLFAYDRKTGEYYFNWNTSGLSAGTYRLRVDFGDGVSRTSFVTLR